MLQFFSFDVPIQLLIPVVIGVVIAAYTDLRSLKIPNVLTGLLLVSALIYHGLVPNELGLFLSFSGVFTAFVLMGSIYAFGGIGAGDVKLFMGIGAWIGPQSVLQVFVVTSFLIGVVSVSKIVREPQESGETPLPRNIVSRFFPNQQRKSIAQAKETSPQRLVSVGILIAIALLILILWGMIRRGVPF